MAEVEDGEPFSKKRAATSVPPDRMFSSGTAARYAIFALHNKEMYSLR
jgi:hypothetical protein